MEPKTVTLTRDLIQQAQTRAGGFTKAQLAVFGISWPPPGGWKGSLVGSVVLRSQLDEFWMASSDTKKERRAGVSPVSTHSVNGGGKADV